LTRSMSLINGVRNGSFARQVLFRSPSLRVVEGRHPDWLLQRLSEEVVEAVRA